MIEVADGGSRAPRLRLDLNGGTLWSLPTWSEGPAGLPLDQQLAAVRAAGYEGFQSQGEPCAAITAAGLRATTTGRAPRPEDVRPLAARHQAVGFEATSFHLGCGLESDAEADKFAAAVLEASASLGYPIFIETHRATVTQDIRRTVDLITRFPQLRFNADLSHWYTGHELPYGDLDAKLDVIEPVLDRVGMLHGRVGDAGAIQVALAGRESDAFVEDFRRLWRRCFEGFLRRAQPGEEIVFAPELLPAELCANGKTYRLDYARRHRDADGYWREESDRWAESIQLCAIAKACFAEAASNVADISPTDRSPRGSAAVAPKRPKENAP